MSVVAVIIPYFQRKPGVLRRALNSILRQELPINVDVNVIVVDDGSPVPAKYETEGLIFAPPFNLEICVQSNNGVAAARNSGLKLVDENTDFIAFIDSDDTWDKRHIAYALQAFRNECDFYFTDNKRAGQHDSYFNKICPEILELSIQQSTQSTILSIKKHDLVPLIIEHFPTQASSVIYRRSAFPERRFPEFQKFAGEDLIFFVQLAKAANGICFCSEPMVECGVGENMYFGNLQWNSPKLLSIISDQIKMLLYVGREVKLSANESRVVRRRLSYYRKNFVFHTLRYLVRNKGRVPAEVYGLAQSDRSLRKWFAKYALYVSTGTVLGLYKPS